MARRSSRKAQGGLKSFTDAMSFAFDCQEVMGRRLIRIGRGDAAAFVEAQRMVAEKMSVAAMAGLAAACAWPFGLEAATERAAAQYRSAVRANRRRLRR